MYLIKCVHIAIIMEMLFLVEWTIKDTTASCRCKGQRRPSLIFMLGKSPIWPSSTYKQTESDRRTNRRIGRLPIFALSRPRNLRRSLFFFLCPVPSSLTSPMVIPARRASETHLNSFRFTSSFRFFRQIFTDLGFFCLAPTQKRTISFLVCRAAMHFHRFPQMSAHVSHYVSSQAKSTDVSTLRHRIFFTI